METKIRHMHMMDILPLLILTNVQIIQGVLEWTVIGKVTDYGKNVTLFCHVPNCCPEDAGWDRWTPVQHTLFIDIKTGRANKKYDGKVMKDGYTLIIQNLTEQDLNVSYSCLYGVTLGEQKFLLKEDVFTYTKQSNVGIILSAGQIAGIVVGVVLVTVCVALFVFHFRTPKHNGTGIKAEGESVPLMDEVFFPADSNYFEYIEGEDAILTCKVRHGSTTVKWLKDGNEITQNESYMMSDVKLQQERTLQLTLMNAKISNSGEYSIEVGKFSRKLQLNIKKNCIDCTGRNTCIEKIKTGKETRQFVRIHVIGKEGAGKTSLVCRLLGREPKHAKDPTSTDGIEVERNCQINTNNGDWIVGKETEKQAMTKRIKKIMQDEKTKEQDTNTLDVQPYLSKENVFKKQTDRELNISTNYLSGTNDNEKKHLLAEEQIDSVEVFDRDAISKNDDEIDIKHTRRFSDATHIDQVGQKINTIYSIDKRTYEPNTDVSCTDVPSTEVPITDEPRIDILSAEQLRSQDIKQYVQVLPSIGKSHENQSALDNKMTDTNFQRLIEKKDEILFDAMEREKKSEDLEGLVECGIWDFAGQKEYYGTHQTFFTPNAIYVIVADIQSALEDTQQDNAFGTIENIRRGSEDTKQEEFDSIGNYISFWLDSIHCFCTNPLDKFLCPPVFMVFTGIDKDVKFEKQRHKYEKQLLPIADEKQNHLRGIFYISNTHVTEKVSEEIMRLKKAISDFAEENKYFPEELPTEWIQLENLLEAYKAVDDNFHVLSWDTIEEWANAISIVEIDKLHNFLTYQHKIGNIIFFQSIPDYIILRPSWLVECFRCLVFDSSKREHSLVPKSTWEEIASNGKLSMEIIDTLFKKETGLEIERFRQYLLKVLVQFDIIIRPLFENMSNEGQELDSYYMPCVIENKSSYKEIKKNLIGKNPNVKITPWLILEFKFLPLAYFNHVLFHYIKNYMVCVENSGHPAIYREKLVFYKDEFRKCIMCFSHKAISLQIFEWRAAEECVYSSMLNELCDCIDNLKGRFSQDISYKVKAKCIDGDYWNMKGRKTIENMNKEENYFCEEHCSLHWKKDIDLENTWFKHAIEREKKIKSQQEEMKRKEEEKSLKEKIPILGNIKASLLPSHLYVEKELTNPNYDWKRALRRNRARIVKGLANPDEVAERLFQIAVFNDEMNQTINQIDEKEQKTRKILDTLNYRGKNGVVCLLQAFSETNNEVLATYLAPYVVAIEKNNMEPKEWPPGINEQHVMLADPVIRIGDEKGPWFIHEYGKEHVYSMQGHCRGKVFLINNVLFGGRMIDRDPSNIDAKNLSKLFEELHFSVQRKDNLTSNDMRSFLQTGAEQIEKEQNIECVILIIMSHGAGRRIYGIDCLPVEVSTLTDCFSTDNCPSLYEKPRLIFIQACRAESKINNAMENRSLEYPSPHFLIAYATPEGTKRWLNKDVGSWFMNALIWTFKYHAHEEELRHLLIRVNRMVANKETGSKEMTVALTMSNLRKKFYFFPGIHGMVPQLF